MDFLRSPAGSGYCADAGIIVNGEWTRLYRVETARLRFYQSAKRENRRLAGSELERDCS